MGKIQFGLRPGCSANVIEPALPEGVPAAGTSPAEPGSLTAPGEVDVAVAPPLPLVLLLQAARAVTLATARASPPMRFLPNVVINPLPSRTIRIIGPSRGHQLVARLSQFAGDPLRTITGRFVAVSP